MTAPRSRSSARPAVAMAGLPAVLQQVLHLINRSESRSEFLERVAQVLVRALRCDVVELRVRESNRYYRCRAERRDARSCRTDVLAYETPQRLPAAADGSWWETLCARVFAGRPAVPAAHRTPHGGYFTHSAPGLPAVACLPLVIEQRRLGLLLVASARADYFAGERLDVCELTAEVLASALAHQRTLVALRERVKELTCLYEIANALGRHDLSRDDVLGLIVHCIAPAWRYPEIAKARIVVDDRTFTSARFRSGVSRLVSPLVVGGETRGMVEVVYTKPRPERDEGPFLAEERKLIDTIARQIALLLEGERTAAEQAALREQLRHSDRLATIGQFAAGMAHELNGPLAAVLGFAQLMTKDPDLSATSRGDLKKIEAATLHAREIVKKLLFFGRQLPAHKTAADLNQAVHEALSMFAHQLQQSGVRVETHLAHRLPSLHADPGQLVQVLVNLIVNAMQAMPDGGTLIVETERAPQEIVLRVADDGVGMAPEVREKIFLPFFTTKDVNQGTGLGLPVVHGIVTAHHGTIRVDSAPGQGARFEIRWPIQRPERPGRSETHAREQSSRTYSRRR